MLQSISSVDDLVSFVASGARVKYLFFWGHRPSADGRITASCLSQWWPAAFTVDGQTFPTSEHYMMWRKATMSGDHETASVSAWRPVAAGRTS